MAKQKNELKRIKTGVPGLDEMLEGGFIQGSVFLVSGRTGSGKTSAAIQFIREGLESGEKCLFISLLENPIRTLQFYSNLNINWDIRIKNKDLVLITPAHLKKNKIKSLLQKYLKAVKPGRLVIDGLSLDADSRVEKEFSGVLELIKQYNVSTVITAEVFEEEKYFGLGTSKLPSLVDGIVVIKQVEVASEILKVLVIIKAKGISYDTKIRELKMSKDGKIEIGEVMEGYKDVLGSNPAVSEIGLHISYGKLEDEFIETFNKKNPNVVIHKTEEFNKQDKISLIAQKNTTLGVCTLFYSQMQKLASEGLLFGLDEQFDKEVFYEKTLNACTFENKIYGIRRSFTTKWRSPDVSIP